MVILFRMTVCLVMVPALAAFGQKYQVTDLNQSGDTYRLAHGINSAGEVVGEYGTTNLPRAGAFWYHNGTSADLGLLAGGYINAYAQGINDSSRIVGWCDGMMGVERGFLYANGTMTNLGTLGVLPTGGYSEAYSINRLGQAVGTASLTVTTINHAVLFSDGTKKDLGALGGAEYNSTAVGINNASLIVGESEVVGSIFPHAFIYSNDVMTDLQTLPGGAYSRANAINDFGVIVGEGDTMVGSGLYIRAFVCRQGPGSMQELGTLGGSHSSAYAINSAGQIVGYAQDSNNVSRAFIYDGAKMADLNDLIPPVSGLTNLEAAVGINDTGQIAAYGQFDDGIYHAFLLTPTTGAAPVTISNPVFNGGAFSFSFGTQSEHTYACQYATVLPAGNDWQTFSNFTGNGSVARVTDLNPTNAQRFYRVVTQ